MSRFLTFAIVLSLCPLAHAADGPLIPVGLAQVEITPQTPIRLNGYTNRKIESEGVNQKLYARALAIGADDSVAVLITVETLGVPAAVTEEVAARLAKKARLPRERLAVCATHDHAAPMVNGMSPMIFGGQLPKDQQERIDRYTRELTDNIETAALRALADRKPGRLTWAQGKVGFAMNRRIVENGKWVKTNDNKDGPVDHALPLLRITDPTGKVRGVLVNYACHCTTLGIFNKIHGDWAGVASELLEAKYPGAVALVAIGCGGDANPFPRGSEEMARIHGQEIADEAAKLIAGPMMSLSGPPVCKLQRIDLPLAPLPTQKQWEEQANGKGIPASHAKLILERLSRGEKLPTTIPYVVQGWAFGDELVMIFLAGEVVVDYSLRVKKELDGKKVWVNSYANDVPCYIASKRLLPEGGYEVDWSMYYYDRSGPLAPEAEDKIIAAVKAVVPKQFAEISK